MSNEKKIENTEFVDVSDKNFVGIGKLVFHSNEEWNVPHLHFMVDETNDGNFEATLLEFGLVSWAENKNDSIMSLVKQTHAHILSVMERDNFDEFFQEVDGHVMDDYWRCYRKIDFMLAKEGRDLSHEMDSKFLRAIKAVIEEETINSIKKIADINAEKLINEYKKRILLSPFTLTFNELKVAA